MSSLGEPTWLRSRDRSLDGWVHRPDEGQAVGAVVIAGPFAHEALVTYRTLRVLAVEAARRGFVAVRFSWSGTGDSEPAPADADLATAWQEDLAAAVDLARAASGIAQVDAIGVRFGAAVVAAAETPLRTRVLWEPLGGRAFLRMQSSLLKMHLPEGFPLAQQGVELCGHTLDEEAAASLRTLPDPRAAASGDIPGAPPLLLEDDPQTAADLFGREPKFARVPLGSIRRALDALEPAPPAALPEWMPERELLSVIPASGTRVRHTLLPVGPDRLPGILTEPVDGPRAATAALFIPFANDPKGAGRVGRATSLRLAAGGIPTLRADRRGIGDAADPHDLAEVPSMVETGFADVAHFAAWLAERTGRPVVGIGLCSGAWLVARAATIATFHRLILVNNQVWSTSRRFFTRQRTLDRATNGAAGSPGANASERGSPGGGRLTTRLKRVVRSRAPYPVRHRLFAPLGRDEIAETVLGPVPERTSVRLLLGDDDRRHWESSRGPDSVRRLRRRGRRIEVEHDPRADHALMSEAAFQAYLDLLDRELHPQARPIAADPATA
jgi:hypothetical protein